MDALRATTKIVTPRTMIRAATSMSHRFPASVSNGSMFASWARVVASSLPVEARRAAHDALQAIGENPRGFLP